MPSRNIVKIYSENSFYHIYNRGVEKRIIFEDEQDYGVFLGYLKEYLSPPQSPKEKILTLKGGTFTSIPKTTNNYSKEVELLAYCLMPNHFHLLIRQNSKYSIKEFMKSISTRYSMYFNKKNNRVGKLFQGHYKACLIINEQYLLHLSKYIHLNPAGIVKNVIDYSYSSYAEYLGSRKTTWIKTNLILSYFDQVKKEYLNGNNTYKSFVESEENQITKDNLAKLSID